jgi:hypothetical protein
MPFYVIAIFISFLASLAGLMLVKENRVPIFFFFSFFLFLTIAVEYVGSAMSAHNRNNVTLYNLFTVFEFTFYLFFYRTLFANPAMKKIITGVIILYIGFALLNILFIQGRSIFQSYTYILGCTMMVAFSIFYFYFLFRFPETTSLTKNSFFWIVAGLMFYYTCTFSLYGLENFITSKIRYYNKMLLFISDLLNALLYTLFSIGFLCKINFRKLLGLS